MATVTLDQSGTANASMKLQVTYTAGNGSITISGIAGGRDSYGPTDDYGSNTFVFCNIGGTSSTLTPFVGSSQGVIFAKNYAYQTFWTGSQTKSGVSGIQTVEFTFSSSNSNANIYNSKFIAYIDAGTNITTPTLSDVSVTSVSRNGASASFTVINNGGASIIDTSMACSLTNWGTEISGITGTSGTFNGLTPNTTYYVRAYASNNHYAAFSNVGTFTTIGNNPTITSVETTPTIDSCDFDIEASYDINDSYASTEIEYGTTSEYGSSVIGTTLTGLDPNTKYYYKVNITSTRGKLGTYTGDFTTLSSGGTVRLKVNGTWEEAKVYLKENGTWYEAVPYIKENGTWEKGV